MKETKEVIKDHVALTLAQVIFGLEAYEAVSQNQLLIAKDVMKARGLDQIIDAAFIK